MYQTRKTYIKPDMKMSGLIIENPSLLLMLEHLGVDFVVQDKTVAQLCTENQISTSIFLLLGNLYNGFTPTDKENYSLPDIAVLIRFLRNTHAYYKHDKYPEISDLIKQLYLKNSTDEIKMIERFFNEYFQEVSEHLDYEEKYAFPYFESLIGAKKRDSNSLKKKYTSKLYREHHSDIETKLADLRNLLLKHIQLKNDQLIRRKLLCSLFELEFDLKIHSLVEEMILIPLIETIEKQHE